MERFIYISVAVLMISHVLLGQARRIEFTEYDLDNGLHVILHQDNTLPIVAVAVLYHVGAKNDPPKRTGFAHFFEHLLFEGSDNVGRGEFDKYISGAGGTANAFTNSDFTFYHEVLPSNQLEVGLWLESERMMHAKIDSVGVEVQRDVVKEEKRQYQDNRPYGKVMLEVRKGAYKVHPYRWTTIGSMEDLNQATLEEFIAFYRTYYVPANATLCITGDIDIVEAKFLVAKYFQDIKAGSKSIFRPTAVELSQTHEVRDTVYYDNIQLPAVVEAYHIPALDNKDSYALNMLSTLLSGGESSRMYKALVDEQQKVLNLVTFPMLMEDSGLYVVFSLANIGVDVLSVERGVNDEVKKVQQELISEREFQKVKNQIESDIVQDHSSMLGIARGLTMYHANYDDTERINSETANFMRVTREDLKRVANKYLTAENRLVLYYLPTANKAEDKTISD